ncbi:MAG: lysoplasmalogenase [Clostridia bacterium]|nr:lysoplasmalogenase [Clostridia bacterium]
MKILPLIFALISSLMPVITQKTGLSSKYGFKIKMLCAFMYLVTGVISVAAIYSVTQYSFFILGALVSGVLGDFFLSYKEDKYFPVGVLFFALGHIVYSVTFLLVGEIKAIDYIVPVLILTVIMFIPVIYIIKVKINLGKMEIPLLIYGLLLLFSFACGVAKGVLAIKNGIISLGLCIISGAVLFVISDIMLGLKSGGMKLPKFLRHAVTYTYFPAQTLFALSICFQ